MAGKPKGDGVDRPAPEDRPQGGALNPDAPVASQDTEIRGAKFPDEKPSEQTIAQVEEIKGDGSTTTQ